MPNPTYAPLDDAFRFFNGTGTPQSAPFDLPQAPPWRDFTRSHQKKLGEAFRLNLDPDTAKPTDADQRLVDAVNTALILRRPLLITGRPGVGKTSLAYAVAHELHLGEVLTWPITSRSTLKEGLYAYDAVGRLEEANITERRSKGGDTYVEPYIGDYVTLGPLGEAFAQAAPHSSGDETRGLPRVVLIDEIDKSDIDFPNDLLHVFERGEFVIPELARLRKDDERYAGGIVNVWRHDLRERIAITGGRVNCRVFPFILMTSNGERDFPAAFKRRCLEIAIPDPPRNLLERIVSAHFPDLDEEQRGRVQRVLDEFLELRDKKNATVSADQLLNAVYLISRGVRIDAEGMKMLRDVLLRPL